MARTSLPPLPPIPSVRPPEFLKHKRAKRPSDSSSVLLNRVHGVSHEAVGAQLQVSGSEEGSERGSEGGDDDGRKESFEKFENISEEQSVVRRKERD